MKRRYFLWTMPSMAALTLAGCGGGDDAAVGAPLLERREVLDLSAAQRQAFVETLHAMKTVPSAYEPTTNAYDYFVGVHTEAMDPALPDTMYNAHMCAAFLPWHREFLRRFEREMQRVSGDPQMTLPYWDWYQAGSHKAIFTDDFLGGNGDPDDHWLVKTGAFREGLWSMGARFDDTDNEWQDTDGDGRPDVPEGPPMTNRGLTRCFSYRGQVLPDLSLIDQVVKGCPLEELLSIAFYDVRPYMSHERTNEQWQQARRISFRTCLEERLHNPVHAIIGKQMGSASSPNDPVFFLHHANVDRLWDLWQRRNGNRGYPSRLDDPLSGAQSGLDLFNGPVLAMDTFSLGQHSGVDYA